MSNLSREIGIQLADYQELLQRVNYFISEMDVAEEIDEDYRDSFKELFDTIEDLTQDVIKYITEMNSLLEDICR